MSGRQKSVIFSDFDSNSVDRLKQQNRTNVVQLNPHKQASHLSQTSTLVGNGTQKIVIVPAPMSAHKRKQLPNHGVRKSALIGVTAAGHPTSNLIASFGIQNSAYHDADAPVSGILGSNQATSKNSTKSQNIGIKQNIYAGKSHLR